MPIVSPIITVDRRGALRAILCQHGHGAAVGEVCHPSDTGRESGQLEVVGLICHVDIYPIQPMPYPHLMPVGSSGEGSSAASDAQPPTLVAPVPPAKESKVTESLFGTTFAHASQIKGLDGDEVVCFVFSDLSVRTEGTFV
ncbi:hypothetical protein JB92DRAFT_3096748, partial [Gautieria morchelliformis]